MSGWILDCSAGGLAGSIPADRIIRFSKIFFSFKVRQKILSFKVRQKILSPTISVYSAIYNISDEIRRNRLNISEKIKPLTG